jgi:transposase
VVRLIILKIKTVLIKLTLKIPEELIKKYPFMGPIPKDASPEYLLKMLLSVPRGMLDMFEQNALLQNEKALLLMDKALLLQKLYGKSSEKRKKTKDKKPDETPEPLTQVFDEAVGTEEVEDNTIEEPDAESSTDMTSEKTLDQVVEEALPLKNPEDKPEKERPKRGRKPLPEGLFRENVLHELSEDKRFCSCGCLLSKIGEEISEQLELIPAQLKVLRHLRSKYACKTCQEGVITTPLPPQPIPKSMATPGLLAHVAVAKFDDHLPLYRQSEIWERLGVTLARSTLSNWILKMGTLLNPLVELMQTHIVNSDYVKADETTVQVLNEPERANVAKSYMWLYMTGAAINPAIVYVYEETRHGEHAKTYLEGFKGTLQTDGYSGYHCVVGQEGVSAAGCWAHARRKFFDVWTLANKKEGAASKALDVIGKLYEIEEWMKEEKFDKNQIKAKRQEKSKPILQAFHAWLIELQPKVPPKSPLATAITYALNQWQPLLQYLKDGRFTIDNNAAESQIRPFTVGRKNWLFMGNPLGAKAGAVLYSLIETAKANGLNPEKYLKFILEKIPLLEPSNFVTLLPWNVQLPEEST